MIWSAKLRAPRRLVALACAILAIPATALAQIAVPGALGGKAPGLYVQVLDGMIHLTNAGGTQNFSAGQFGYVPSYTQPPVILPANPGIKFSPPPAFSLTAGSQATIAPKSASVDCVVR